MATKMMIALYPMSDLVADYLRVLLRRARDAFGGAAKAAQALRWDPRNVTALLNREPLPAGPGSDVVGLSLRDAQTMSLAKAKKTIERRIIRALDEWERPTEEEGPRLSNRQMAAFFDMEDKRVSRRRD